MARARALWCELDIIESGRHIALGIRDQLHQEHTIRADVGLRDTNARTSELEQGVDLGILPKLFLHLFAVAGAFFHGSRLATVFNFTAFGIRNGVLEATLLSIFVHFGTAYVITAAHHINGRFFAAHQLTQDIVNQAFFNQRPEPLRDFHCTSEQTL